MEGKYEQSTCRNMSKKPILIVTKKQKFKKGFYNENAFFEKKALLLSLEMESGYLHRIHKALVSVMKTAATND